MSCTFEYYSIVSLNWHGSCSLPEAFWKELDQVKQLWKNRNDLKVEHAGVAVLFSMELYAQLCASEIVVSRYIAQYQRVLQYRHTQLSDHFCSSQLLHLIKLFPDCFIVTRNLQMCIIVIKKKSRNNNMRKILYHTVLPHPWEGLGLEIIAMPMCTV